AQVFTAAFANAGNTFSLERFQLYSVRTARLARTFAQGLDLGDDPFTAAIVHNIGELVLAIQHPATYAKVRARVVDTGERADQVEKELLGATHAAAGAATLWAAGVPFGIVECVAYHHTPRCVPAGPRALLAAIHAVDALAGIVTCGEPEVRLDMEFLESVGLSGRVAEWRRLVEVEAASWE
ncbi:MAG: HDOD domain-containing protein, partial [Verrucomicrobia bacterium]|nr:HDOD domain-containing protein [Verrucomicrobiota bacterium]